MKLQNVIILGLLLKCCVCFSQSLKHPLQILIDPGHGGIDSGAVGKNGVLEKDLVLQIAKQLTRNASSFDHTPAHYYLTRYADTLISLGDRTDLAKQLKADLFISLYPCILMMLLMQMLKVLKSMFLMDPVVTGRNLFGWPIPFWKN